MRTLLRTFLGTFTFAALMVLPTPALARIEQPLPPADSLGPPPVPCFPYGSSESICPENGFANPDPPEFLAATYYGTLEVQNHLVHIGEDIAMSARTNNGGKPLWPTGEKGEPLQLGEVVSGCAGEATTCTWKAEEASPYPPSEASSDWQGGWQAVGIQFCGFFGCAPSEDYFYVIGDQEAVSGYVRDSSGKPATGVDVAIQGPDGGVAAEVDPRTGYYNALVPEGSYDVSVEREGPNSYSFGAGKVTKCTGTGEGGSHCVVDLTGHTGEANFEMPLAVTSVEPEHGALKGGQTIDVFGTGFTGAEAVEFVPTAGGAALPAKSFKVESDDEIAVETPDASGALEKGKHALPTDVQVTNGGAKSPVLAPADRYTFGSQHKLRVSVTSPGGGPEAGVKLAIVPSEGARVEGVTGEDGSYSEELDEGTYTVTPQPPGKAFPEGGSADPDCQPSNVSCIVNLNQERSIKFTSCVVPNPNGSPLPTNTPNPIPGAQTVGNLEAVGCWTPHEDGTYTSTEPVRLDGIDVAPESGTTITLHPDALVTSEGSAKIGVGGLFSLPVDHVELNFQASTIQAADLGTSNPTFGVSTSIKGVPFSLTTGSTLQTLLPPWQSTVGQTTANIDLQLPTTLNATSWNSSTGNFANGGASVPSIGATAAITVTNREGLVAPQICGKFTGGEFKLWNLEANTSWISQATACYDFHLGQWTLTGLFQLPESAKLFNKVNISIGWLNGWNWDNGSIQVDGINKQLADGVFLQRIGASFHRDFVGVPPTSTNFAVNAGFSFGPQLNKQVAGPVISRFPSLNGAELFSLDGEGLMQLWSSPAYYKLTGNILLLRGTPLQSQLAGGYVDYYTSGRFDLGGELRMQVPFVHWGVDGQMSGFLDTQRNVTQLSGTDDVTGPWTGEARAQALINNTNLVLCFSHKGSYDAGGVLNMATEEITMFKPGTCEIGKYSIAAPEPPAPKVSPPAKLSRLERARVSASRRGPFKLRLPAHLSGTTIAIRGKGAPPLVAMHGPGLSLRTPPGGRDLLASSLFLVKDARTDTTYVTLYEPHGGTFSVSPLPGSPPIVSVRAALPAPKAKVRAKVSGSQCGRTLTYTASIPPGESVALYAQNGEDRSFLGDARRHGKVSFAPDSHSTGAGQIVALEMSHSLPRSEKTIASFKPTALAGPEQVTGLRRRGRELSWSASCDAATYTVVIHRGKQTEHLSTKAPHIALPKLPGRVIVAITALDADGHTGPTLTRAFRL
ncbi:MAG TPA: carboxypeptidase-like regulatory domain-containing protein [Solirubrobacteraceae bacterium]